MKLRISKSYPSEAQVIEGCLKGDSKSQKHLYDQYAVKMLAVCQRYVRDVNGAEDVMVHAFMKVFEKIGQFRREGSFEGWIRRIMVNEALSHLRKSSKMKLEVEMDVLEREPDYSTVSTHLEVDDLMHMISLLPDGYRTVFNMYAIEGYSHQEIATQLGISENTSKSQLSRARATLKKNLLAVESQSERKTKHDER